MLDTVAIADLVPEILAHAPNVPDFAAQASILRGAREFCRHAWVWKEWIGPVDPVEGATQYQLPAPLDAEIVAVLESDPAGLLRGLEVVSGGMFVTVRLDRETDEPLRLRAVFQPSVGAEHIPEVVVQRWDDVLVHAALYHLLNVPKSGWTDHNLAMLHRDLFRQGMGHVRRMDAIGYKIEPMRVRTRRFI